MFSFRIFAHFPDDYCLYGIDYMQILEPLLVLPFSGLKSVNRGNISWKLKILCEWDDCEGPIYHTQFIILF